MCNAVDDDCDGAVDEDPAPVDWYYDADADGYGDAAASSSSCEQPNGYLRSSDDCDDADATVHPGAGERFPDDDDATDRSSWYTDADGDGYGDAGSATLACSAPAGTASMYGDCDDADAAVNPAATGVCDGVVDEDRDGTADEDDAVLGDGEACAADDCLSIHTARPAAPDGVYWIEVGGATHDVVCHMTPHSDRTQRSRALPLRRPRYRNDLHPARPQRGPLRRRHHTVLGRVVCVWLGTPSSGACALAYEAYDLTSPTGESSPCAWHYGPRPTGGNPDPG